MAYNPQRIEKKWQRKWEKNGIYKTPDRVRGKKNFYHLVMFPYSSGDLHIGHWYNFVGADVYARLKKMQGFNVMSPIGFDAFGLPAENAAIRRKIHPKNWTYKNIAKMRKQLKSIGALYDWSREVITSDADYYKWTQWMFLQFFKAGLAYRTKVPANFCPSCKTTLANEQVVDGKCERCDSEVLQEEIEQWVFKITKYTEDLLKDLEDLDWPEKTKLMQKNWIGKSEGTEIKFPISNFFAPGEEIFGRAEHFQFPISVFTTRPDTLFGATYLVLAPEHPVIEELKPQITNYKFVEDYIKESRKKTEKERISEIKEKTGVEIKGIKAVNPVNNRVIPIFVADYVLIHYGKGAIMAVPAHDLRDWDFAKKYNLPIIEVIKPSEPSLLSSQEVYEGEGILVNSERFNGMESKAAKERIVEWLAKKNQAQKAVCYKLRDWIISRQRYWGAPIPLVFCENCKREIEGRSSQAKNPKTKKFSKGELLNPGWIAVPEKDLPVLLPQIKDYLPTGGGKSPLAKSKKFVETICPKCKSPSQRETDTMDTFVCSSWYYLRYPDPHNDKKFAAKQKIKNWLPVSMYIGGAEHSVMHLLYARFFTKVLKDLGYLDFKEPFSSLRHQGIILGPNGQKMSKSKGNVVDPDAEVKKYGSDTVRMYLCFMGPYAEGGPWNPKGIMGLYRFLSRIFNLVSQLKTKDFKIKSDENIEGLLQRTIKKVSEDLENFRFNTAISALMIFVNEMEKSKRYDMNHIKTLLLLLAPLAPHLTDELWAFVVNKHFDVKNSIHNQSWPKYHSKLAKEKTITLIIQINGKVRDKMEVEAGISEKKARELAFSREKIKKWIESKEVKKIIFIPEKLINIVV